MTTMNCPCCPYCEEPIGPFDLTDGITYNGEPARAHWECAARAVLGSVGHLNKKCSCYGGHEEDPPGMTKREAARAALHLYQKQSRERRRMGAAEA